MSGEHIVCTKMVGMIYRFIKSDRFKRVLFLVDRTALGEQAEDVFKEVKIEELMTLDSIYNIKGLVLPPSVIVGKQTALCVGGSRGYLAQAE